MAMAFTVCFFLLSSLLLLPTEVLAQTNGSIAVGASLSTVGNSSWTSPFGDFSFGFRQIENSDLFLLSIWFAKIPDRTIVWYANGDMPAPSGSVVTLTANRGLVLTSPQGELLWKSNQTIAGVVARGVMNDTGNFVLEDEKSAKLWETFKNPTDTMLPGQILERGGKLSSRKSETDYSKGSFQLDFQKTDGNLVFTAEKPYYSTRTTSGTFPGSEGKQLVFNDSGDFYILRENGRRYNFTPEERPAKDYYLRSTFSDGVLAQYFLPRNFSGNVTSWVPLWSRPPNRPTTCMTDFGSPFELKKGYFQPVTSNSTSRCPYSLNFVSNGSYSGTGIDCKNTCLQYCDCLGFDFLFDNQTGCRFWSVDCEFVEDSTQPGNASSLVLTKLMPTENSPPPRKSRTSRKWIWIGVALSAALVVMAFSILCYLRQRRRKSSAKGKVDSKRPTDLDGLQNDGKMGHDLSVFSYESVISATMNFAEENKLGEGGFGPVYKGKLATGQEVAVKRLSKCSGQGTLEFKNELMLIHELQHTNLVQLFGFCIHGEERILIYEYMPNKSLDYFLFDPVTGVFLDWSKRFSIIEGIAQGLLYLHKFSRKRVIHRDLKASNVLLDETMNPKISDFGMARIFSINELEANTSRIVGTRGYMPPEYVINGVFSAKSDVYSFGVLVLEIVSGRRNNSFYNDDRAINLVGYAWELWKEGVGTQLMDPTLAESCTNKDKLLRCINVALLCVEDSAANRPTMSDVLSALTNESSPLPAPTKPAFSTDRYAFTSGVVEEEPHMVSVNDLTISDCEGR